jgi:hypothetical protein
MNPDVYVTSGEGDGLALVAQVKTSGEGLEDAKKQLRHYMLAARCPVGLLVTPERTLILRDTLEDYSEGSISVVGDYPTGALLRLDVVPTGERDLEQAVVSWLRSLIANWPAMVPTAPDAREPVAEYVVPNIADGRVVSGSVP